MNSEKIPNANAFQMTYAVETEGVPAVDLQEINYAYGQGENRFQVLFDNHLTIHPGEIVIMTGPSGSGKTTLLTLIGALRAIQEGSMKILGKELQGLRAADQVKIRRNIGFIFQHHNLFESLTAFQNVKMATELHEYTAKEAAALPVGILEKLELGSHLNKRPHDLSGGQRQRVAIARALVNHPKLILADEPTAALDKDTGRQVVNILQELAKTEGSTVLIVTHDNRILDVADRIVRMVDGYIVSDVNVAESIATATFLKKCSVFKDASPTMLSETANQMEVESHPAGADVIRQGDVGDKFYIIQCGQMEVKIDYGQGPETVAKLGPGDFFGELALLREEPRAATVTALDDVDLLTLSKDLFIEVVESTPSFEDQLKSVYFNR